MKKRFGELSVGQWFKELPKRGGAVFTFPLQKVSLETKQSHDGKVYYMNTAQGKKRTFFDHNEMVELVEAPQ
jgi:hypothetical protein